MILTPENKTEIIASVLVGVIAWGSFKKPRREAEKTVFEYSVPAKIVGGIMLLLGFGFIVLATQAHPQDRHIAWPLSIVLCLSTVWMFLEFMMARMEYDNYYVYTVTPWRANRRIPWEDIKTYKFSEPLKMLTIDTHMNGKVYASAYLSGIKTLTFEIQRRTALKS